MSIKKVTIAGGGVLGSQIALQTAVHGFEVTVYDISQDALDGTKEKINNFVPRYIADLDFSEEHIKQTADSIKYTDDINEALGDADLLIEAIVEQIDIKKDFYGDASKAAPEKTIFASNTSTLLPSEFMDATDRPEKFIALHFANEIWLKNTAEVMKTSKTSDEVFQILLQFAKDIGMVALPLEKEQPGYILNTMLTRFITAAMYLFGNKIADHETIDKVWLAGSSHPVGPFGVMDPIGMETIANITRIQLSQDDAEWRSHLLEFLEGRIEEGKLGKFSGEGFYKYPNPAFLEDDFLNLPEEYKDYTHSIKQVAIVGAGVFGRQLAFQTAKQGFSVTLYDHSEDALSKAKEAIAELGNEGKVSEITYVTDLKEAVKDADLVIEAIPEVKEEKLDFFKTLSGELAYKTILVSATSTLLPSELAPATGHAEKFAAMNFSTPIWDNYSAEIMPVSETSEDLVKELVAFARDIDCLPFVLKKEQAGYILTTLSIPVLYAALLLVADDISPIEAVDKTWMITRMTDIGPFGTMDRIGLRTVANIAERLYGNSDNPVEQKIVKLVKDKVEKGETGVEVGKGFYDYSDGVPYLADDFLK